MVAGHLSFCVMDLYLKDLEDIGEKNQGNKSTAIASAVGTPSSSASGQVGQVMKKPVMNADVVMKRPAMNAGVGIKRPAEENKGVDDQGRDRGKARKFLDSFDNLPKYLQQNFQEAMLLACIKLLLACNLLAFICLTFILL